MRWTYKYLNRKGLIEEVGRLDTPGKPILYGTTEVFLEVLD
ncbi:SMC-Scp complex subunit ScpB [Fenollaria sporofastidiosus]